MYLLSLNVCGLMTKILKYDVFLEKLAQRKIVCLSEVKAASIDCKTIEHVAGEYGFEAFCKPRMFTNRKSGGLCTLIANDVKYVKAMPSELGIVQWFHLSKTLFGIDKDVLLGNVYIPPQNPPYAYQDTFLDLELIHTCQLVRFHRILYGFSPFLNVYGVL